MKRLIPIILMTFSINAMAEGWTLINDSDTMQTSLMNGSFKRIKGNNTVISRMNDKSTNRVNIIRWAISDAECKQGYGKMYALDIGTNKTQWDNDFAFESGSVGSFIAEIVCAAGSQKTNPAATM